MSQQYGTQYGEATAAMPTAETSPTQRYEEARAAAALAMSNVAVEPNQPATGVTTVDEPEVDPELLSYRGFKFGAAFFGWLIAVAMSVLLLAAVSAAAFGTAEILDYSRSDAEADPGAAAITAAAVSVLMLALAYYIGGYVAGRLARFDGGRNGFGVWMISLLIAVIAAGVGAFVNHQYDVLADLDRPNVNLTDNTLTLGGAIAAAALLLLTLGAAILGGKTGKRYHDKIDRLLD
ncbi:hypothetical protein [Kribbella sp. NPDC055071]